MLHTRQRQSDEEADVEHCHSGHALTHTGLTVRRQGYEAPGRRRNAGVDRPLIGNSMEQLRRVVAAAQQIALCEIAAQLIPKEFVMKDQSIKDLSDEQISEMLAYLSDKIGKNAKLIDAEVTDPASVSQEED